VEKNGEILCTFDQHFTLLKPKFSIEFPNNYDSMEIKGDYWAHEYEVFRTGPNAKLICTISKKYFSWTDSYCLRVVEGEDVSLMISFSVIIDRILQDQKQKN